MTALTNITSVSEPFIMKCLNYWIRSSCLLFIHELAEIFKRPLLRSFGHKQNWQRECFALFPANHLNRFGLHIKQRQRNFTARVSGILRRGFHLQNCSLNLFPCSLVTLGTVNIYLFKYLTNWIWRYSNIQIVEYFIHDWGFHLQICSLNLFPCSLVTLGTNIWIQTLELLFRLDINNNWIFRNSNIQTIECWDIQIFMYWVFWYPVIKILGQRISCVLMFGSLSAQCAGRKRRQFCQSSLSMHNIMTRY